MSRAKQIEAIADMARTKLSMIKDWLTQAHAKVEEAEAQCQRIETVAAELEPVEVEQFVVNSLAAILARPADDTGNHRVEFRLPDANDGGPMILQQEDLRAALIREFAGPVKEAKAAAKSVRGVPDFESLENYVQAQRMVKDHHEVQLGIGSRFTTMGVLRGVVNFLNWLKAREVEAVKSDPSGPVEMYLTLRDERGNEVLVLKRKYGRIRAEADAGDFKLVASGPVYLE